tara:strand:- start:761 stop:919 length:159 start_codon:yes stop_codon:yes gene_type:complete
MKHGYKKPGMIMKVEDISPGFMTRYCHVWWPSSREMMLVKMRDLEVFGDSDL